MEILGQDVITATKNKFEEAIVNDVQIIHFTQEPSRLIVPDHLKGHECVFCKETKALLTEICGLSDKIELKTYDFFADKEKAEEYGIDKIPATLLLGEKNFGIRFFGIPSGYEYTSLIEAILDTSRRKTDLDQKITDQITEIEKDIHIQVFVTPTCPYCTMAVRLAHQFALVSPKIKADMVESTEFPHLAHKFNVAGVPKTVINETVTIDGAVPEDVFLEHVLKAAED